MKRTVNLTALLRDYRAACYANGINPATGNPARCDNPHWWKDVALWDQPGPAHSIVEAAAIQSIAAQARAAMPKPAETLTEAMAREFRQIVKEVLAEELPLRELHRRRGVEVVELAGLRVEVAIRKTA